MIKDIPAEISHNIKRYNRYNDILPTPATRVRLQQYGSSPETTYINANYIPFDGNDKAYIAAMGPLTTTIGRFELSAKECCSK
jgi:protein tyrosine phosphatase